MHTLHTCRHDVLSTDIPQYSKKVNCPAPYSVHVFQRTKTIFKFSRGIITTNIRTKVLKCRRAPLATYALTNFQQDEDIIGTIFLTKFHDNQAINVTFRVLTRKNVDDVLRTNGDPKSTP
ncbi:hypothetical protein DPMN_105006 [Dreissena polymorpha]|uniref:Uncharacterized protein n=1 Tax=Dreissena polymorpha TaxID=45954 RepID=A0A9D4HGA2_DREPO|nr:hypothetical protein DPMN_105006 [Dreissena polymorpha]